MGNDRTKVLAARAIFACAVICAAAATGCNASSSDGDDTNDADASSPDSTAPRADTGAPAELDASSNGKDAGAKDARIASEDAEAADTSTSLTDAKVADTSTSASDAKVADAGTDPSDPSTSDAALDANVADASAPDANVADTGTGIVDASTPDTSTGTPDADGTDAAPVSDGGQDAASAGSVGSFCAADVDCSNASITAACSNDAFSAGTLFPTPVCIGTCAPTGSNSVESCDDDRGICIGSGTRGTCLPACTFDDSGAAPVGCKGKNLCSVAGYGTQGGAVIGVGVCFGGCAADLDCTGGDKCQLESGVCVKPSNYKNYTKALGAICSGRADTACECQAPSTGPGLCTTACKTGATARSTCPTGFLCTADLPKTGSSGGALFTKQPVDMAGTCRKSCTVDADCGDAPIGYCDDNDVLGKVCTPGPRPAGGG